MIDPRLKLDDRLEPAPDDEVVREGVEVEDRAGPAAPPGADLDAALVVARDGLVVELRTVAVLEDREGVLLADERTLLALLDDERVGAGAFASANSPSNSKNPIPCPRPAARAKRGRPGHYGCGPPASSVRYRTKWRWSRTGRIVTLLLSFGKFRNLRLDVRHVER